jgi:tRNA-splicing endonuclease subunit Sen34
MFAKGGEKAKAKREERARLKAAAKAHAHAQAEGEGGLFGSEEIGQVASPSTSSPMKAVEQSKSEINTIGHGHDNSKLETPPAPTPAPTPKSAQTQTQTQNPAPTPGHFHTTPSHPSHHNSYLAPITSTPHSLFPFPNNNSPREIAKSKTFNTLNSLNYRMGLGPRFGGEYLIYPGDYLRYHAHFTSQVVCWDQSIRPIEIVAWGRLGTGTKKAGLICCVPASGASEGSGVSGATKGFAGSTSTDREESREEEEKGGVEFYSLEWANFG